jgi:hypothetical protein
MSSVAVNASHRTPSGSGAEASRRNRGDPSRSARITAPIGSRFAHGDPANGAARVTTVSTSPVRRPPRDGLRDDHPTQAVSDKIAPCLPRFETTASQPRPRVGRRAAPPRLRRACRSSRRRSGLGHLGFAR